MYLSQQNVKYSLRAPRPGPELDMDNAEPLPKMAYDTVSIKTIRERLSEYSLPTEGEKPVLAARHQR